MPADEIRRLAPGVRLLSLCGGPGRADGLDVYIREWGAEVVVVDIVLSESHNTADEGVWSGIRSDLLDGVYDGGGNAPP